MNTHYSNNSTGQSFSDSAQERLDKLKEKREIHESKRMRGDLKSQRAREKTELLLTRSTTGAIYAISILVCLYLGSYATAVLVAAMTWLCCSEFFRIMRMGGRMPSEVIGLLAAVVFPLVALVDSQWTIALCFVLFLATGLWYIWTPRSNISDVAVTFLGPIYTGLLLSSVVRIRMGVAPEHAAFLTFAIMGSIWLNDSFAYLIGSRIGRHKMAPRISPNKSWEGFLGGLIVCIATWVLMSILGVLPLGCLSSACIGICVGIFSVMGDLFESRIKRGVGVKDSGNLMPGHGGLLDRSDSLLFGVMAAELLLRLGGIL